MQQTTGVPLVVMVKPDTFLIQEIKTLPAKAKVSLFAFLSSDSFSLWAVSIGDRESKRGGGSLKLGRKKRTRAPSKPSRIAMNGKLHSLIA